MVDPAVLRPPGDVGAELKRGDTRAEPGVADRAGLGIGRAVEISSPTPLGVYGADRALFTVLLKALSMQPAK